MPRTAPFERHDEAYEAWFEKNRALYEAELESARQLLPPAGASGLEVGVGSGRFAAPLGIRLGVEPARPMAARARARGIRVVRGVAEHLPFANGAFDFVLLVTTICFVDSVTSTFQEAFRVLRPGGQVLVGFVDRESALGRRYEQKRARSRFYREATFFSAGEVQDHLRRAGFAITATRQTLLTGAPPATIREGTGAGAFVVLRGQRE